MAHSHEWYESDGTEKCRKCGAVNKGIHTHPYTCWEEHLEVTNDHMMTRRVLTDSELREIGKFTRENVRTWMESHKGVDWFDILCWGPIHDFHAVCGDNSGLRDMEIPWAKEESRQLFERVYLKRRMRLMKQWDVERGELLAMLAPGQFLALERVHAGYVSLSVRDGETASSNIVAVTDEKLLAKLRSVKGQFVHEIWEFPIFYYEHWLKKKR